MIEAAPMFFLATADREARPQCSYKGGAPGFVQILGPMALCFPCYDGNGMYLSMGNVLDNPLVQLLFIDFEQPSAGPGLGPGDDHRRPGNRRALPRRPVRRPRRGRRSVPELPPLHPPHRGRRAVAKRARRRRVGTARRVEVHADVQRRARRRRPRPWLTSPGARSSRWRQSWWSAPARTTTTAAAPSTTPAHRRPRARPRPPRRPLRRRSRSPPTRSSSASHPVTPTPPRCSCGAASRPTTCPMRWRSCGRRRPTTSPRSPRRAPPRRRPPTATAVHAVAPVAGPVSLPIPSRRLHQSRRARRTGGRHGRHLGSLPRPASTSRPATTQRTATSPRGRPTPWSSSATSSTKARRVRSVAPCSGRTTGRSRPTSTATAPATPSTSAIRTCRRRGQCARGG